MAAELFEKIGVEKLAAMLTEHFGPKIGGAMVKVTLVILWAALIALAIGTVVGVSFGIYEGIRRLKPAEAQPASAPVAHVNDNGVSQPSSHKDQLPMHKTAIHNGKFTGSQPGPQEMIGSCRLKEVVGQPLSKDCVDALIKETATPRNAACAQGANCSNVQSGGVSIGTINQPR